MTEQLFPTEVTFSVSELGGVIQTILGKAFEQTVWVRGEIRSITRPKSGHVYFQIVEPGDMGKAAKGSLDVVLWNTTKQHVNQKLKRGGGVKMTDGVEIRIRAAVDFYPPHGRLQLRMIDIDPTYTLGRLAEDREKLLAELADEGLLDANAALPAPLVPLHIALVTSKGSAAHADFMDELHSVDLNFTITVLDTPVQGPQAPAAIARSIERASAAADLDLIVLIRGGGSRTELAAFDAPEVARAIARSTCPVWTGVGHEIDESIADRVAQRRLKTPTACAAAIVASVRSYQASLEGLWIAIRRRAETRLEETGQRLDRLARQAVGDSRTGIAAAEHRLSTIGTSIEHRATLGLNGAAHRLDVAEAGIRALDPATMLARGWSITRRANGTVVTDPDSLQPGEVLDTQLAAGAVRSIVADSPAQPTEEIPT